VPSRPRESRTYAEPQVPPRLFPPTPPAAARSGYGPCGLYEPARLHPQGGSRRLTNRIDEGQSSVGSAATTAATQRRARRPRTITDLLCAGLSEWSESRPRVYRQGPSSGHQSHRTRAEGPSEVRGVGLTPTLVQRAQRVGAIEGLVCNVSDLTSPLKRGTRRWMERGSRLSTRAVRAQAPRGSAEPWPCSTVDSPRGGP